MPNISLMMVVLFFAGIGSWVSEENKLGSARYLSLFTLSSLLLYFTYTLLSTTNDFNELILVTRLPWITLFNIDYALALDYLSILLVSLTLFLAIICTLLSWQEINKNTGFYYLNLLFSIAGIIGVFCAVDMFLFFFFWEVMLLPMTALIAIWGHENRHFAAIKFFIFTQVSSLFMLVAIIAMALIHTQQKGQLSFFYLDWLTLSIPLELSKYIMLGFFIAFAVKLPLVPFHSWLPDAHTQAPTAGSVLLAGVLLKTGAYGFIRFVLPLFPQASERFAPTVIMLALISILYGAKMAFAQQDIKRLIAYSSISHMGFVLLALFSFNALAYQGAILTLVAHGLSSAALFSLAGMIYSRIHSRDLANMGGFFTSAPRMGGFALVFVAAAFGLPSFANFIGEFLTLLGAYQVYPRVTIVVALVLVGSAIYGLKLFQQSFQGEQRAIVVDLSNRELFIFITLSSLLLIIGFFPELILTFFTLPQWPKLG